MIRSQPTPGSAITALLGPTNTGKTHRCVSRMLEYDSGMIGLPLRLLAREVYDRVAREAHVQDVALVTGEERIVPPGARYWVCTTEAMPTHLEVDFVGVDEIQLCAHPTRGHVFTERLLHARGRFETWFLGAATMRRAVEELVPTAHFQSATRLSKLSFSGACGLGQIPGRCAVVAFSVPQVYELAERLRVRKGGVAVVLGALSPKTRNAQVSMYQAGEVDHVVATDAIGMGLNMSIAHVALASLHKFDGRTQRTLSAAELAQIAGRAGRAIHDGSFGTIEPAWLDPKIALEIEHHMFPQQKQLVWRNRDLDYSSLDALVASLQRAPSHARLRLVQQVPDTAALTYVAGLPNIKPFARNHEAVRLLWEVCQIPDYRQLTPELHADLLFSVFEEVMRTGGQLDDDWMATRLTNLTQTSGDIDTLMGRIAFVRTWTYVCQRHNWIRNAAHWQQRTRQLEDALSDALHDRLIARFVSRRRTTTPATGKPARGMPAQPAALESETVDSHHPFAALVGLRTRLTPLERPTDEPSNPDTWELDFEGNLLKGQVAIAKLVAGATLAQPRVQVLTHDSGKERTLLLEDAQRALRNHLEALLGDAQQSVSSSEVRGMCYQLRAGLGTVATRDVAELAGAMSDADRTSLERAGIVVGTLTVFRRALLKLPALRQRFTLARAFFGSRKLPAAERLGHVSLSRPNSGPVTTDERAAATSLGYVATHTAWTRCDTAERVLALDVDVETRHLASLLGCKKAVALRVYDELRQGARLPPAKDAAASRNASRMTPKRNSSRFRREHHAEKVKHDPESTVASQK